MICCASRGTPEKSAFLWYELLFFYMQCLHFDVFCLKYNGKPELRKGVRPQPKDQMRLKQSSELGRVLFRKRVNVDRHSKSTKFSFKNSKKRRFEPKGILKPIKPKITNI